jgi:transcription-repair coupling factor (superfamily II helicase)
VLRLLELAELRIDATLWSIKSLAIEEQFLAMEFGDQRRVEQLSRKHGHRLKVLDGKIAYWPIAEDSRSYLDIARSLLSAV